MHQLAGVIPNQSAGLMSDPCWFSGSSHLRWGSQVGVGQSAGDEEHARSVVLSVGEAACDAAVQLDQSVHGFSASIARAVGLEVGQERLAPAS